MLNDIQLQILAYSLSLLVKLSVQILPVGSILDVFLTTVLVTVICITQRDTVLFKSGNVGVQAISTRAAIKEELEDCNEYFLTCLFFLWLSFVNQNICCLSSQIETDSPRTLATLIKPIYLPLP